MMHPGIKTNVATLATNSNAQPPKARAKGTPEMPSVMQGNRYTSVSELLHDLYPDDPKFVESYEKQREARRVVRNLEYMRLVHEVSQAEVAQVLGCQQARVSKIENGYDADLTLRILEAYAIATGFELELTFRRKDRTLVDDIEECLKRIQEKLEGIMTLADRDESIVRGAMQTQIQTLQSAVETVRESAGKLPQLQDDPRPLTLTTRAVPGKFETAPANNGRAPGARMAEAK